MALEVLRRAFDAGVTFYDTADHYSLGRSEQLLGRAFARQRDRVIIASKVGTWYSLGARAALQARPLLRPARRLLRPFKRSLDRLRATQRRYDFSPRHLRRSVEASLKRLDTDYLDLLQLHKPAPAVLRESDALGELERLRRDGKIRYYGIACDSVDDALECLNIPGVISVQITISLLDQAALPVLLPSAARSDCAVIARNPRGHGHLARGFEDITAEDYALDRAAAAEMRRRARMFGFLQTGERSLAQAAVQFVRALPGVTVTLPRALDTAELGEALGALTAPPLGDVELATIRSLSAQLSAPAQGGGGAVRRYGYRT